jgi:hypothetical protein
MILNAKIQIPNAVFEHFAAEPASPLFSVGRVADAARVPIHGALNSLLAEVPPSEVELVLADPQFQFFARPGDPKRQARIWFIERLLMEEIPRRKLALLRAERRAVRPRPYNIPALADLEPDDDHLVPLSAFECDGARLLRNGYAFTILTTTPAPNSTHWLLGAIASEGVANSTSVRLDPYLFGPEESYPAMFYKMWMYGRPLDWERIGRLRDVEHGEWRPGPLSRESSFTQFCWSPRDGEVHFVCEEVPKPESISREAARYLHAIYDPRSRTMQHFDGAIRIYDEHEIGERGHVHVRTGGKAGIREKVFRCDDGIPREAFSAVTQAFFVWNEDVREYVTSALAPKEV